MPLYLVMAKRGTVPDTEKEAIAEAFTDIHCGLTFAPPSFVHVYFLEDDVDPGGETPLKAFISGNIRADRTAETKDKITQQMRDSLATTLQCSRDEVGMTVNETPANWTMEGGHLLPAPGEEDAWLERHEAMQNSLAPET